MATQTTEAFDAAAEAATQPLLAGATLVDETGTVIGTVEEPTSPEQAMPAAILLDEVPAAVASDQPEEPARRARRRLATETLERKRTDRELAARAPKKASQRKPRQSAVAGASAAAGAGRTRTTVSHPPLVAGMTFRAKYKGAEHIARVIELPNGAVRVRLADGRELKSLSLAGTAITGNAVNGWRFWTAV